jgi:hypothetical protein
LGHCLWVRDRVSKITLCGLWVGHPGCVASSCHLWLVGKIQGELKQWTRSCKINSTMEVLQLSTTCQGCGLCSTSVSNAPAMVTSTKVNWTWVDWNNKCFQFLASLWWNALLPVAWQHVRGRASEWKQKGKTELTWWLWVRLGHFAL